MKTGRRARHLLVASASLALLIAAAGCAHGNWGWHNWFDPSRNIRRPEEPAVNLILEQIGPADRTEELVPNATKPRLADLEYSEEDYIIGPTDILRISVLDLFQEGLESLLELQVSHSGYVVLPYNTRVKASGRTAEELIESIKDAYDKANILRKSEANVSVVVVSARQNIFSILGAISRPGTYALPRKDFTLLEALALAGDVSQVNIEWVYVIRPAKTKPTAAAPAAPEPDQELPPLPTLPSATKPTTDLEEQLRELEKFIPGALLDGRRMTPRRAGDERILLSSVGEPAADTEPPASAPQPKAGPKWVYSGGRWIRVERPAESTVAALLAPPPETEAAEKDPFGWKQYDMSGLARIIAVDLIRLKSGDPKMNIKIRDKDIVHIPPLRVGEFYVMGEVLRPGVYNLTARRVTAKQAVAAAGSLGVLSWPNNSILIRRVGRDTEQVIRLPLNDIFAGRENDIYLKPDDVIAVGSHWSAPFLAVWRNAFRMTYGFGFIYDRNYSERDFEIPILAPKPGFRPYVSD